MFCVSHNLAAFYNLRANSANPDISQFFVHLSDFSKKMGLGYMIATFKSTQALLNNQNLANILEFSNLSSLVDCVMDLLQEISFTATL